MHKFNRVKFDERKQAKKDLQKPHTPPKSVSELRDRVEGIEVLLGIKGGEAL